MKLITSLYKFHNHIADNNFQHYAKMMLITVLPRYSYNELNIDIPSQTKTSFVHCKHGLQTLTSIKLIKR
jgi:hypothetical protein